jgi:hypothetical protein
MKMVKEKKRRKCKRKWMKIERIKEIEVKGVVQRILRRVETRLI